MKPQTDRELAQGEIKKRANSSPLRFVGDEAEQFGDIVINVIIPKLHAKIMSKERRS
jgi:hypothetical protein